MESYNLDKLVKIETHKESVHDFYSFKKEIKILGIVFRPKGFYSILRHYYEDCPENHFLKDGIVYLKPRIILTFIKEINVIYFDTFEEALEFQKKLFEYGNWITDDKIN